MTKKKAMCFEIGKAKFSASFPTLVVLAFSRTEKYVVVIVAIWVLFGAVSHVLLYICDLHWLLLLNFGYFWCTFFHSLLV